MSHGVIGGHGMVASWSLLKMYKIPSYTWNLTGNKVGLLLSSILETKKIQKYS